MLPSESYYSYFQDLLNFANEIFPNCKIPKIKIVYSLNKVCETFNYKGETYIVYDKYLGQSFNKFNRLIYHENKDEARAYLCKLMGEEFYLNNDIENSICFLIYYHLNRHAIASDLPIEFIIKKTELILIQESFVFFHELTHIIIKYYPELKHNIGKFLMDNENAKFIVNAVKELLNKSPNQNEFDHFVEEVTCDFTAMELTYKFYKIVPELKNESVIEGISLAFLYLRTLFDLKIKATNSSIDVHNAVSKFRYNLIRSYFSNDDLFTQDRDKAYILVEAYDNWEDKIDMLIVLFLDEDLKKTLNSIVKKKGKILYDEATLYDLLQIEKST